MHSCYDKKSLISLYAFVFWQRVVDLKKNCHWFVVSIRVMTKSHWFIRPIRWTWVLQLGCARGRWFWRRILRWQAFLILFPLVLCCLVSSRLVSYHVVSSHLVLSCLVLSCRAMSCLLSCLVLSWFGLAWLGFFWLGLAWLGWAWLGWTGLCLSWLYLSCRVASPSYLVSSSFLVMSYRILSCLVVSCCVVPYCCWAPSKQAASLFVLFMYTAAGDSAADDTKVCGRFLLDETKGAFITSLKKLHSHSYLCTGIEREKTKSGHPLPGCRSWSSPHALALPFESFSTNRKYIEFTETCNGKWSSSSPPRILIPPPVSLPTTHSLPLCLSGAGSESNRCAAVFPRIHHMWLIQRALSLIPISNPYPWSLIPIPISRSSSELLFCDVYIVTPPGKGRDLSMVDKSSGRSKSMGRKQLWGRATYFRFVVTWNYRYLLYFSPFLHLEIWGNEVPRCDSSEGPWKRRSGYIVCRKTNQSEIKKRLSSDIKRYQI
jgi:hypothetical protein